MKLFHLDFGLNGIVKNNEIPTMSKITSETSSMERNISLVYFDVKHIADIQNYASKFENTKYTNVPHPYPMDGAQFYQNLCIENQKLGESIEFAIEYNGAAIGLAGILHLKNKDEVQIGYWIDNGFWNRGIGRVVIKELLEKGKNLNLGKIYADVLPENKASSRILEINGFSAKFEHTLPETHHKFPCKLMQRYEKSFNDEN
ncbi:MAG: GNAT family N-acetyltransferase [Flavobacteriales bacterium]|nr:GNAT family N-acetyltransferase [Flavobacteriales bacterium]